MQWWAAPGSMQNCTEHRSNKKSKQATPKKYYLVISASVLSFGASAEQAAMLRGPLARYTHTHSMAQSMARMIKKKIHCMHSLTRSFHLLPWCPRVLGSMLCTLPVAMLACVQLEAKVRMAAVATWSSHCPHLCLHHHTQLPAQPTPHAHEQRLWRHTAYSTHLTTHAQPIRTTAWWPLTLSTLHGHQRGHRPLALKQQPRASLIALAPSARRTARQVACSALLPHAVPHF